ncbi:MAG: ABC transporter ATP-binding protein [Spirochaetales bacterium]|nr:ABC transporter ATP-binding protein [Spirochaetales bacterium]
MENSGNNRLDINLLGRLFPYLKKYIHLVILSFVFLIIVDVSGVLKPYIVKFGIDNNIIKGDVQGLVQTVIFLGFVLFSEFLFQFLFTYSIQYLGLKLIYNVRMDLFKHATLLSNHYFDNTPVGNSLSIIANDVEAIRQFISEGIVTIMGDLLKIIFIMGAMVLVNYKLALIAFLTIPFFILATIYFRQSVHTWYREVRKANAEINTSLVETITGVREINIFQANKKCISLFKEYNTHYLLSFLKVIHSYAVYFPLIEIISTGGMVIILIFSHFFLGITVQIGEVFAFFAYIQMFFRPLREISEKFNIFQSAMAASERIFRLKDQKIEIKTGNSPVKLSEPVKGDIEFDHVDFSYRSGTPVLKDISFRIKSGEKLAIVGYTGSGKTTIINLLNRLYDVDRGEIRIDGTDIKLYDLYDLRSQIATVPQSLFLFTGTIADNISLYNPDLNLSDIKAAARAVGADSFIEKLPDKYGQEILEEGRLLSVGQKQLLGCARAFIKKPSIIILDEATSSIDAETEKLLDTAVQRLLSGRTAIIIAHRLTTVKSVDRILVIHRGCLVEEGTHTSLLKLNGIYKKLYNLQVFSMT